jgi:hypothetical protein
MRHVRYFLIALGAVVCGGLLVYGTYLVSSAADPVVAGAVIAAISTIIISSLTLALGRYFEKKRDLEALHREKKIPIYTEFLEGVFNVFYGGKQGEQIDIVSMLQKWQIRIVVWGGADVVNAYLRWKDLLSTTQPTAKSLRATNDLILAIRKELGHNDLALTEDLFARFILREYELYAGAAKANPNISLAELGEMESKLAPQKPGS